MQYDAFAAFEAGWNARYEYETHDWGPSPPDNARGAYARWLKVGSCGHIIAINGCKGKLPDGRECHAVNR